MIPERLGQSILAILCKTRERTVLCHDLLSMLELLLSFALYQRNQTGNIGPVGRKFFCKNLRILPPQVNLKMPSFLFKANSIHIFPPI